MPNSHRTCILGQNVCKRTNNVEVCSKATTVLTTTKISFFTKNFFNDFGNICVKNVSTDSYTVK